MASPNGPVSSRPIEDPLGVIEDIVVMPPRQRTTCCSTSSTTSPGRRAGSRLPESTYAELVRREVETDPLRRTMAIARIDLLMFLRSPRRKLLRKRRVSPGLCKGRRILTVAVLDRGIRLLRQQKLHQILFAPSSREHQRRRS